MEKKNKLLRISCESCGSPVGYDIPAQTYRCVGCGMVPSQRNRVKSWNLPGVWNIEESLQLKEIPCPACGAVASFDRSTGVYRCDWCGTETEPEKRELNWRSLKGSPWQAVQQQERIASCPSCGARVLFQKEEASETCPFCGSHLVQSALTEGEHLPEFVLPFVLTEKDAKEKLGDWAEKHRNSKDGRRVRQNLQTLKGYYLPYYMIRGPIQGRAYRDRMSREYHYRGFLECAVVNASKQLDNQVLDAAEPFYLSALQPFEPAFLGGHRVKLGDLSSNEVDVRTLEEAAEGYRPYVARALQNTDVEMQVESGELMNLPILLPVYVQQVGRYLAVVNGQTGKIAVASSRDASESKLWLLEPSILTILCMLAAGAFFAWEPYPVLMFGFLSGLVFFIAFGQDRNGVLRRKIYQGKPTQARRRDGELETSEGEDFFKNPLPNTPAFYESDGEREARVELRFYTPDRIIGMLLKMLILIFLPAILASGLYLLRGGTLRGIPALPIGYGAAWYVMAGTLAIIYWIRGVRWDIYNHPVLYELLPDGRRKLFGSRKSRRLSILSLFHMSSLGELRELGKAGFWIIFFLVFLLVGSTAAILF